ncbi:branched-chain amino acid aminotransferase [Mesobacillus thioparans]|uniref:branched-chain amino acid aminotransferase n=1 Tax=Mesobacillus thioparans TaxID=370439 RepID=UPI0039EF3B27
MLKNQVEKYIASKNGIVELHIGIKEYAERNGLLQGKEAKVLESGSLFDNAYIERGDKETEEFLGEESSAFLEQSISYFKDKKNEFIYMESNWFELIGVDAISFENDDVFGTFDVMLGLKLQKKHGPAITKYLDEMLPETGYDLMFDGNEGLWSLNFALNGLDRYREDLSIREAYSLIYSFLFKMAESIEKQQ